jgi:hypothetical protein
MCLLIPCQELDLHTFKNQVKKPLFFSLQILDPNMIQVTFKIQRVTLLQKPATTNFLSSKAMRSHAVMFQMQQQQALYVSSMGLTEFLKNPYNRCIYNQQVNWWCSTGYLP